MEQKKKGFGYQLQEICFGRKPETLIDSKQILGYPLWELFSGGCFPRII